MPTLVEDYPFQRAAGIEEQGSNQDLQQILDQRLVFLGSIRHCTEHVVCSQ